MAVRTSRRRVPGRASDHDKALNSPTRVGRDDDIKRLFGKYGDVKDVYSPLNYYTK
jgi:hypothetical protein